MPEALLFMPSVEVIMKKQSKSNAVHMLSAAVLLLFSIGAEAAPGEDQIILTGKVSFMTAPLPRPAPSGQIESATDIPAWMQARISRYTAKAYSAMAEDGTVYTNDDVVTSVQVDGLRKTCVQEVGSNTAAANTLGTRYGPKQQDQVVVLRGDLVNICR